MACLPRCRIARQEYIDQADGAVRNLISVPVRARYPERTERLYSALVSSSGISAAFILFAYFPRNSFPPCAIHYEAHLEGLYASGPLYSSAYRIHHRSARHSRSSRRQSGDGRASPRRQDQGRENVRRMDRRSIRRLPQGTQGKEEDPSAARHAHRSSPPERISGFHRDRNDASGTETE